MFCKVYYQRHQGKERPSEFVRSTAVQGELALDVGIWDERPGRSILRATLVGPDRETYVLPVLDRARVTKVSRTGLLIEGTEVVPRGIGMKNIRADYYPQAWWCVPQHVVRPARPVKHETMWEAP